MKKINQRLIKKIANKIAREFQPEKIILFGSRAYGEPDNGSDLDFLIIKNSPLPRHKRAIEIQRSFYNYFIPMDIVVYTREEVEKYKDVKGSFIHTVMKKGKVLYG